MLNLLKTYQRKLTNLTSANRSIFLPRLSADSFLDFNEFDFAAGKSAFHLLEDIIKGKKEVKISDYLDSRDSKVNVLSKKIAKIWRKDKLITEERGTKDLYIGYPFVRGKLSDGSSINCPLLFFPVDIALSDNDAGKGSWKLVQRKDTLPAFNKSFLLAYSHFNKVSLGEEYLDFSFEETFEDSLTFRNILYQFLKTSPLEINFNTDIFTNQLQHFETFSKQDFDAFNQNGSLKLFPQAVLGFFPQAGSYLSPDYEELIDKNEYAGLENLFEEKTLLSIEKAAKEKARLEENMLTPLAMDASQEKAIGLVKAGHSLVVQGPPGTGKSQLICNLVSDYIARNKRVLVVCQKRAALDVVYQRLSEMGIGEFIALVHDFRNDRSALYEQLNLQIQKTDEYKSINNSLDAIWLEREFLQASRGIDRISEDLQAFKTALFDESKYGISAKELYIKSNPKTAYVDLNEEASQYDNFRLAGLKSKYTSLLPYALRFENHAFLWKQRVDFKDFGLAELRKIEQIADAIPAIDDTLRQKYSGGIADLNEIYHKSAKVQKLISLLTIENSFELFANIISAKANNGAKIVAIVKQINKLLESQDIEYSIPSIVLRDTFNKVETAISKHKVIHTRIAWSLFSKDKSILKPFLSANNLRLNKEGLSALSLAIEKRMKLEKHISDIFKFSGIPPQQDWQLSHEVVKDYIFSVESAIEAAKIYTELPLLAHLFKPEKRKFLSSLEGLARQAEVNYEEYKGWKNYFSKSQLQFILEKPEETSNFKTSIQANFDSVAEYDRLLYDLNRQEADIFFKIFNTITTQIAVPSTDDFNRLLENSFYLAWIGQLETAFPILRTASTLSLSNKEVELQELILKKQQLSRDILLLKIREFTYKSTEYNRLNNRVTYRDLQHQVTKKRKIWKLRKLLMEHKDEIFNLVPCWLASPETVSAIFPMEQVFDLVIFDEASQCFAEKGLPAISRARQVVITGDDKQLQPNDLYQPRWENEEDDTPDLEIDSLLNLAEKYLPQTSLTGHYRSKSLELIAFSNEHFYKNTLQLLPDFHYITSNEPAINYLKIEGVWHNNANEEEAAAVVNLVGKLLVAQPGTSIGVVTFNMRQQELILEKLEVHAIKYHLIIPSSLFVKNIENVQGDERDIIIFSIAYAPDSKGKLQMQFGSLNQKGGENRLNVAVTRAKEKIFVVSSILPSHLKTENTANPGPQLLKKYLEYAWQVSNGEFVPTPKQDNNFRTDWYLKNKIMQSVLHQPAHQFPFSDLVHDGRLLLTDDNLFYSAFSVKETFAYNPVNFRAKHWDYLRLYSRNYWADREGFLARLKDDKA